VAKDFLTSVYGLPVFGFKNKFGGVWDTWRNRSETVTSCAIATTAANELVDELHDRMPAILPAELQEVYLNFEQVRREESAGRLRSFDPIQDSIAIDRPKIR